MWIKFNYFLSLRPFSLFSIGRLHFLFKKPAPPPTIARYRTSVNRLQADYSIPPVMHLLPTLLIALALLPLSSVLWCLTEEIADGLVVTERRKVCCLHSSAFSHFSLDTMKSQCTTKSIIFVGNLWKMRNQIFTGSLQRHRSLLHHSRRA